MINNSSELKVGLGNIELPSNSLGRNCIIDGLYNSYVITQSGISKILSITLNPGKFLIDYQYYELFNSVLLNLDISPLGVGCRIYLAISKLYTQSEYCTNTAFNKLVAHCFYTNSDGNLIQPQLSSDLIGKTPERNLILAEYIIQEDSVYNNTKDRDIANSYHNYNTVILNGNEYFIQPFDTISRNISRLIKDFGFDASKLSGGTGGTGATGGLGETGGTGESGGSGGTGEPGAGKSYLHSQYSEDTIWNIFHDLKEKYIHVQCINVYDEVIIPNRIKFVSPSECVVTFDQPVAGYALCIGGRRGGSAISDSEAGVSFVSSQPQAPLMIPGLSGGTGG